MNIEQKNMEQVTGKGAFALLQSERIEELNATGYLYEHNKTKAQLFYLDAADDNKVFSISFRTTPMDHTGVAHITEHSVLCGSRKFPLKEPFVELVKGSLNTFLNAMTYPDKTMYPVASKNDKDFHNLMDVYLDAVFFPNVVQDPDIIKQEGWHYELESVEAPLTYKGVVYNEMKGVYSSPDTILDRHAMELLFPDVTYGIDSGGDPSFIPTLTFEGFLDFYKRYYHPSNSYIFLYGTMNLEEHLTFIDEEYLSKFDAIDPKTAIPDQVGFSEPKVATCAFPTPVGESTEGKSLHTLYFVLPKLDAAESLALEVLTHALVNSPAAPLREKIVKAGLGSDVSAYYVDHLKQHLWQIQVTGSEKEKQSALEILVLEEFARYVKEGVPRKSLESSLNTIEFSVREADFGGKPKGLFYNIRALENWLYDENPMAALRYDEDFKVAKEGLTSAYYENILEKVFLNNSFRLMMTAFPEPGLGEKEELAVQELLATKKASFTEAELLQLVEETKQLAERQAAPETQEALETIPLLEIEDIQVKEEIIPREEVEVEGVTLHVVPEFTNGVGYLNYYFNLEVLTAEELPYAYLLSDILGRLDTEKYSYQDLNEEIGLELGGLYTRIGGVGLKAKDQTYLPLFVVRGKALFHKVSRIADFAEEVMHHTKYDDTDRLKELLQELKAGWDMEAFRRGHSLAMTRLLAQVSPMEKFSDVGALSYYEKLTEWAKLESVESLATALKEVANKVFRKHYLDVLFVGNEKSGVEEALRAQLSKWTEEELPTVTFVFDKEYVNEGITSSGQVQYVAQGGNFRAHGYEYTGAMKILETILKYDYLWTKIRVQGGAYGAFATFKRNGDVSFCSYRDPNLTETYDVYEHMAAYIEAFNPTEREMRKYIIGTMSQLDIPMTPYLKGVRALVRHYRGITTSSLERLEREVLQATAEDIRALAPVVRDVIADGRRVTLGNETKVKEAEGLFSRIASLPN